MTLSPAIAAALVAAVRSERDAVEALLETLIQERQILERSDTDRLAEVTARKREQLFHLAQLGEHRDRLLLRAAPAADRHPMRAAVQATAGTDELRIEWQSLLEATQQANRLNQENGFFIEAGMRANQQALSVLMSATSGGTYGPAGRALNPLAQRTLASA